MLSILLIISCSRCKEQCTDATNPDCPNYVPPVDPCAGSHEVRANFVIEMDIDAPGGPVGPNWLESSYCIADVNHVRVRSTVQNATSYLWILGVDTFYTQEHIFNIPAIYAGQNLPVTLIVVAPTNASCFPNDDGRDTTTKYVTVKDICTPDIYGTYRGSWQTAPNDSFNIKITRTFCYDESGTWAQHIVNLDQSGDSCGYDWMAIGNFYLRFGLGSSACSSAIGYAQLQEDKEHISIVYQLFDPLHPLEISQWPYRNFMGHRIQ